MNKQDITPVAGTANSKLSTRISFNQKDKIAYLTKKYNVTTSDVIRTMINKYLEEYEQIHGGIEL